MASEYKMDLHTHSILSQDGGISKEQYKRALEEKALDFVAITDHNEIDFALEMNRELGDKAIVGEEVRSVQGDVIGLFLRKLIPQGLEIEETIDRIKTQQGLVYLPHPLDHLRAGVGSGCLENIADQVDIVEIFNARIWSFWANQRALQVAKERKKPMAASSDAHCFGELGKTYTLIDQKPTRGNLVSLLSHPSMVTKNVALRYRFSPALNRLVKLWRRGFKLTTEMTNE